MIRKLYIYINRLALKMKIWESLLNNTYEISPCIILLMSSSPFKEALPATSIIASMSGRANTATIGIKFTA